MTLCSRGRSGLRRTLVRGLVAMSLIAATPRDRGVHLRTSGRARAIRGKLACAWGEMRRCENRARPPCSRLVLALEVLNGVVGHERRGDEADHCADSDVGGDGIGRLVAAV